MKVRSTTGVPAKIAQWDETFSREPDRWFFGREPSDLARQTYGYWKELYGDRKARILDFGCGEGRDAVFFTTKGFEVTAVDGSAPAIAKARRLARENGVSIANIVQEDVRKFPLVPDYDILHSNNCLQFLGAECIDWLRRLQDATPAGGLNSICVFTREAEHLAGRRDLYRFDHNELKFHYRDWRILQYRESLLWREPAKAYLSFAAIVSVKV